MLNPSSRRTPPKACRVSVARVDDILIALASQHAELAELVDGVHERRLGTSDPLRRVGRRLGPCASRTDRRSRGRKRPRRVRSLCRRTARLLANARPFPSTTPPPRKSRPNEPRAATRSANVGTTRPKACVSCSVRATRISASRGSPASSRCKRSRRRDCRNVGSTPTTSQPRSASTLAPTDRLRYIARLAWRTLPYAFQRADMTMHGPVALDLIGPHGERWRFDPDESRTHNDPRVRRRVL